MKEPPSSPGWPSIIIAVIFVVAALGQCGNDVHHSSEDACGNRMRPVTIGGSMVVGCQR